MAKVKMPVLSGILESTDPTKIRKSAPVFDVPLDRFEPFHRNPFKPYDGRKLDDLVERIQANGILQPIIARSIDDLSDEIKYEILAGHNRFNAAKIVGLDSIPTIVKEGLSDEEAFFIVTETNLILRSFWDMTHSERAVALSAHHDAIKQQGRRADLIKEVEDMLKASDDGENETCSPMATRMKSLEKTGQEYALSKDTVARYLRVNKLIEPLKKLLDEDEFGVRAAVALSYLTDEEQQIVNDVLASSGYKLDTDKAEALRQISQKKLLERNAVERIFAGTIKTKAKKNTSPAAFKLKPKIMSKYFSDKKPNEIEEIIIKALDLYEAQNKSL